MIGTDGAVWNANSAFCSLVGLDEPALRHLGWRQLVHSADRRYVAAHLVEVLAGERRPARVRRAARAARRPRRAGPHARGAGARQRRAPGLVPRGGLGNYVGSRPRWTWSTQSRTPPSLELPPLVVREPLEAFLDAHGIGEGRLEAERIGEGHSNITFLVRRGDARVVLRRPPRPPLPPSAHDVLREARLLKSLEGTPVRVPDRARRRRRRVGAGRAVLRDGGDARERARQRDPAGARHPRGAAPHRRGARGRARRAARRGLARLRPRGLRQAHRLPRAPAAPLQRALGAQQDARAAGGGGARRVARRATCRSRPSRRSCTATTGSAT